MKNITLFIDLKVRILIIYKVDYAASLLNFPL
jgi:hypothetical protein